MLLLSTLLLAYQVAVFAGDGFEPFPHARMLFVSFGAGVLGGTALIGMAAVLFFRRLAADIDSLRLGALDVIGGGRAPLRPLDRDDELGDLAAAINAMVQALAAREHDLEIERRNVFHQEKMAAIGALAARVLHEIGNPIAAIDGFARAMKEVRAAGPQDDLPTLPDALSDPDLILEQTQRLQAITRRIGELTAPHSSEVRLVNLNELVQTTLMLLHFDPRLEGMGIESELDSQLPAVEAAGDRIVQLLMNLVVNAADAMRPGPAGVPPTIRVRTESLGGCVVVTVADNGPGMDDSVLARVFEPGFSNQPAGRGNGLGLPLCRAIAEQHRGWLSIDTWPGGGTRVSVRLPLAGAA